MTRREIERRARGLIAAQLLSNPFKITDASEFARDLGANEQDMADVRLGLEAEFGIKISLKELAFAETVGTAIDLVETKLENRRAA